MDEGWTLALTIEGPADAPVVVLGHSLGSSHIMWDDVVPLLRERVRVIRYDLPGHGGSATAPTGAPMDMTRLVAALMRSLDAVGVTSFHLAGLSLGGLVTLAGALSAPGRVLSATVMSSGPVNLPSQAWSDKAALVRREGTAAVVDATFERWFSPSFAQGEGAERVERIRREFLACCDEGYAQCCEILSSTDLRPGLVDLVMPVLLVSAEGDAALPWAAADNLAAQISAGACDDVEVVHIPGARHMSAVEQPRAVAEALLGRMGIA